MNRLLLVGFALLFFREHQILAKQEALEDDVKNLKQSTVARTPQLESVKPEESKESKETQELKEKKPESKTTEKSTWDLLQQKNKEIQTIKDTIQYTDDEDQRLLLLQLLDEKQREQDQLDQEFDIQLEKAEHYHGDNDHFDLEQFKKEL